MKNFLAHLTGIVFVIAILLAGGCNSATNNGEQTPGENGEQTPQLNYEVVTIYVKKVEGKKHLELFDSNDPTKVIDNHSAVVEDGTEVFWVLADDSGLKKIKKIAPKKPDGNIIHGKAKGIWLFTKHKKHIVPDNQTPNTEEEYYIKVKDEDGERWEIDPYLRIRDR